jgi:HEAT repeat protein
MWLAGPLFYLFTLWQILFPLGQELAGAVIPHGGRTVAGWISLLRTGRDADVSRAVTALIGLGAEARPAVPMLREVFEHGPPWQRRSAAMALGSLGATCPEAVEVLREGMKNPNMTIRRSAYEGLARLDAASLQQLAPELATLLDEQFGRFRRNILDILEQADLHPDKHLTVLKRMLTHSRSDVQRLAVTCFRKAPRRVEHNPLIESLLKEDDFGVRNRALQVLCLYAGEGKVSPTYLVQAIQHEDQDMRRAALDGLMALGAKARAVESELLTLLDQNAENEVRLAVAEALWLACKQTRGKTEILTLSREGTPGIRSAAINLLSEHAKGEAVTLAVLRDLLQGKFQPVERVATKPFLYQEEHIFPLVEEALENKRQEVRQKAMEILRDLGPNQRVRAVNLLIQCCRQETDPVLQYRAALFLWHRERHPTGAEYLALLLNEEAIPLAVRRSGIWQLPVSGPLAERVVPHLLLALKGREPQLREWAAAQLAGCTVHLPETVETLRSALSDKDRDVREAAALTLRTLGPSARSALPDLMRCLEDDELLVQKAALPTLAVLHPEPLKLLPHLVPWLAHYDGRVRRAALDAILLLGKAGQPALPMLRDCLRERDNSVRRMAVRILEKWDLPDEQLAQVLTPLLDNPEDDVRSQVILLLGRAKTLPVPVLHKVRYYLWQSDGETRLAAAWFLWRQDRQPFAFAVLRNGLKDRSTDTCLFAIACLTKLGPDARPILPLLRTLLQHKDRGIAQAAREALEQLAPTYLPL